MNRSTDHDPGDNQVAPTGDPFVGHKAVRDLFDALDDRRHDSAARFADDNRHCHACGHPDPLALCNVKGIVWCRACLAIEHGRSSVEDHHPAGRANDPDDTLPVGANDHAALSAMQHDWPCSLLTNPTGSPLVAIAAKLRAWIDTVVHILVTTLATIPEWLLDLNRWLTHTAGPYWWDDFEAWRHA